MPKPVLCIEVPYEGGPLDLEPGPHRLLNDSLLWLADEASREELPRILTSTVLLWHRWDGTKDIGACLNTAIIWERG